MQLCLAVWRLYSVKIEKCACVNSKITPIRLLNETTKGGFFERRTHGKALEVFFLLEVGILPDVLHHVGDELHSLCEFQGEAVVFFVLDTRLDIA